MTVCELYEWAKDRDLLDKQIAKHFNFNIEEIDAVYYMDKSQTMENDGLVVVD